MLMKYTDDTLVYVSQNQLTETIFIELRDV